MYGVGKYLHPSVLMQTESDLGAETSATIAKDQVSFPLNTPWYILPSLPLSFSFAFALAGWLMALPASASAPAPTPTPAPAPTSTPPSLVIAALVAVLAVSFTTTLT